jgi:hypothetical protein
LNFTWKGGWDKEAISDKNKIQTQKYSARVLEIKKKTKQAGLIISKHIM